MENGLQQDKTLCKPYKIRSILLKLPKTYWFLILVHFSFTTKSNTHFSLRNTQWTRWYISILDTSHFPCDSIAFMQNMELTKSERIIFENWYFWQKLSNYDVEKTFQLGRSPYKPDKIQSIFVETPENILIPHFGQFFTYHKVHSTLITQNRARNKMMYFKFG